MGHTNVDEIVRDFNIKMKPLFRYIPWFEEHRDKSVCGLYSNEGIDKHSISIPIYDSNLLRFIKEVNAGNILDNNYRYIFTRKKLVSIVDIKKAISDATIRDIDVLIGILSKYVYEGNTKAKIWNEAVRCGIFLEVLIKSKELIDYWSCESRS